MRKWAGEVSISLIQVCCLKKNSFIKFAVSFSLGEQVWAWQVHFLRWMVYPDKKTAWHTKYFVLFVSFVFMYLHSVDSCQQLQSCLLCNSLFLNVLPFMFSGLRWGEWIWQIWANPSISSLPPYSPLGRTGLL